MRGGGCYESDMTLLERKTDCGSIFTSGSSSSDDITIEIFSALGSSVIRGRLTIRFTGAFGGVWMDFIFIGVVILVEFILLICLKLNYEMKNNISHVKQRIY